MKKIILLALIFLTSCQSFKFKNDQHFNDNIHNLWDGYFTQNFIIDHKLNIFIATNREAKNNQFNCSKTNITNNLGGEMKFGICQVKVSKNHIIGEVKISDNSNQKEDNSFKITSAKSLSEIDFIKNIIERKRDPLVFVHGFNVDFEEAVIRAAQIGYDLKYQGPIIVFSWPAGVKNDDFFDKAMINKTYQDNQKNAAESIKFFSDFLTTLKNNKLTINLLVHSMGHQVVLPAIVDFVKQNPKDKIINKLILNAADFEAINFALNINKFKNSAKNLTIYCSDKDKALIASKNFNNQERLGSCVKMDVDIDLINVSEVDDASLSLNHGYYSSKEILTDIFQNLIGINAENRLFIKKAAKNNAEKYRLRK
jgi:esterase/lipase superfamily enzyme